MRIGNPRGKLLLAEKLFLMLIGSSLLALGATITYAKFVKIPVSLRPSVRPPLAPPVQDSVTQITEEHRQVPWVVRAHRADGRHAPTELGSDTGREAAGGEQTHRAAAAGSPSRAQGRAAAPAGTVPRPGVRLPHTSIATTATARARHPSSRPSSDEAAPPREEPRVLPEARSVFVPSRIGLRMIPRTKDAWPQWPDAHERRITGQEGRAQLAEAFALVARSRAAGIAADLERKGIPISFGSDAEFTGEHAGAAALLSYGMARPPVMGAVPTITVNPKWLYERPEVLAAVLVHEGTRMQQLLEGTLTTPGPPSTELEFLARWNEAAFWEEVRGRCWPFTTALEQEMEFTYRSALSGEGSLRDTLAALHR